MSLCGDVLYIQIKKYVKFGATASLSFTLKELRKFTTKKFFVVASWHPKPRGHLN